MSWLDQLMERSAPAARPVLTPISPRSPGPADFEEIDTVAAKPVPPPVTDPDRSPAASSPRTAPRSAEPTRQSEASPHRTPGTVSVPAETDTPPPAALARTAVPHVPPRIADAAPRIDRALSEAPVPTTSHIAPAPVPEAPRVSGVTTRTEIVVHDAPTSPPVPAPAPPTPPRELVPPAFPARALAPARGASPAPRLSIGRVTVEVTPPAAAEPAVTRARPQPGVQQAAPRPTRPSPLRFGLGST